MEKIKHMFEMLGQFLHMQALLSLLVGLMVLRPFDKSSGLHPERSRRMKKRPWLFFSNDEIAGDNIPASLMDGLNA